MCSGFSEIKCVDDSEISSVLCTSCMCFLERSSYWYCVVSCMFGVWCCEWLQMLRANSMQEIPSWKQIGSNLVEILFLILDCPNIWTCFFIFDRRGLFPSFMHVLVFFAYIVHRSCVNFRLLIDITLFIKDNDSSSWDNIMKIITGRLVRCVCLHTFIHT
jgi:hypothetical protein